ncbi:hypothetical protein A2740_00160 [Candidatus Nomurabacteria bacterium RIFCSPHIGHO2_01_FULL_43_16]|uniref:DedA family protein n=2 Tax=Candidatus Nomuraibacteriota TaxID=1752729 RepID=A0A0G1EPE8_9BACT|nr:MAG: hypothetical protein UV13_C0003G0014 [Parcubacteria group bacterium GW2011_GWC1_42_21]KKS58532.1 MAG: hypothetical protein UV23_C0005G0014 [Candidatus Nomurabacteria bacterium GW2011_GWF1_42_40]KKT00203.1 MAG: hypothetical protein UV77_C0006G0070 [Candidatus Nomurabacteria bacterium GW2011_GWA1_43_17]KKT07763.1 MAG: hypothetical protein UV85_C0005G0014 [Candidatus Nomurabacteria bacterium GW2011_GWB1_43_19]KKT11653.1 MAG: hypothetical protein UV91_C0003G0042 [Candidatus Nomurabacteria b
MIELIEWSRMVFLDYPSFQFIIVFLGAAFGGELAILALSFLVAQNVFPLFPFFLISVLGVFSSDTLWFILGRTKTVDKISKHRYTVGTVSAITEAIRRLSRGNHFLAFIFAKFVVGTRVVIIMYVSRTGMTFKNFIRYNIGAIFIWLIVLIPIGFLSGLGFNYISHILEDIYAGIGFIFLILLVFVIIQIWINRILVQKEKEIIREQNL